MSDTPKWHGWATPDQVFQMMDEMSNYLLKTDNHGKLWRIQIKIRTELTQKRIKDCQSMTYPAQIVVN